MTLVSLNKETQMSRVVAPYLFLERLMILKKFENHSLEKFRFPMLDRNGGLTAHLNNEPPLEKVILGVGGTRNRSGS